MTKARGMKSVKTEMQPKSHNHTLGNAKECEGMSPQTPKWAPTLGVGVSKVFQIFRKRFEKSKLIGLKISLYH
jgi:hypothetical protein